MYSLLCGKFGCWSQFSFEGVPGALCLALATECFGIGGFKGCPLLVWGFGVILVVGGWGFVCLVFYWLLNLS